MCLLVLLFLETLLSAYEVILPEDEAPAALFPVGRTDEEVSLFITGTWEAALSAALAFQIIPGTGIVSVTSFPEIPAGFGFSQTPDITLSFWYLNKYFFETTLAENFADSLFLLGYQGTETDTLRSLTIGNTGTALGGYSFLQLPDSPGNSLGARWELAGENSLLESVLRYYPSEDLKQTYRGLNIVEKAILDPADYLSGVYFALPDREISSVTVLLERSRDHPGAVELEDGRYYSEASAEEVQVSASLGLIQCAESPVGRVLAGYVGMTIGETVFGVSLADRVEILGGSSYFVLYEPGLFSPFQVDRYYRLSQALPEESWRLKVYLSDGSKPPEESQRVSFRHDPEKNLIALTAGAALPFEEAYKYPLMDDGLEYIYNPNLERSPADSRKELTVEILTPTDSFQIDAEYLASSVRVYRNGYPETGFSLEDDGTMVFDREVQASDTIEIYYRTVSYTGKGGDLVFGTGGSFQILPGMQATLGLGVVWNILSGSYSTSPGDHPGSVLLTGGLNYSRENLDFGLKAGISVSTLDTTGILRLKGMEESGITPGISETSIYPAAPPTAGSFPLENRGRLFFRDYTYTSPAGTFLQDYTWSEYLRESYETGMRVGPYTVSSGSSGISGNLLGLDWEIDETGDWVGAQMRISGTGGRSDLTDCRSLSFLVRGDIPANTEIHLHLGMLGEDLDGDGLMDMETGRFDNGFAFNDTAAGVVLRVGAGPDGLGNGTLETEDADGNGILGRENADLVADLTAGDPVDPSEISSAAWRRVRIFISEADRKKLTRCTGLRILLRSTGGESAGTLLLGDLRLEGSVFTATEDVTLAQVREDSLTGLTEALTSLAEVFPEARELTDTAGKEQQVLDLRWDGDFTLASPITPVPPASYNRTVLYLASLEITDPASSTMTVSLTDGTGAGFHCSFPPPDKRGWHRLEIHWSEGTAFLDDGNGQAPLTGAVITSDTAGGYLTVLSLSLSGSPGGRMLLDEIIMTESNVSPAAGVETTVSWERPGPLLYLGDTPAVADLKLSGYFGGGSEGFLQGILPGKQDEGIRSSLQGEVSILSLKVSAGMKALSDSSGGTFTGEHRLRFPDNTESYLEDWYVHPGAEASLEKGTRMVLRLPSILSGGLTQTAYMVSGDLIQEWQGEVESLSEGLAEASLAARLSQVSRAYDYSRPGYFTGWWESYRLFLPAEIVGNRERTGRINGSLIFSFPPASLSMIPEFSYIYNETEDLLKGAGSLALSLPFRFGDSPLNQILLSLTYKRMLSFTRGNEVSTSYGEDVNIYTFGMGEADYFFTSLPFYEIFSFLPLEDFGNTPSGKAEAVSYTPSCIFTLLRRQGSFLRDLFIPSAVELTFSREMNRELESLTDAFVTDLSLRTGAINLFGRRGAYPGFSWYDTDEYVGACTLSHRYPLSGEEESFNLVYQLYLSWSMKKAILSSEQRLDVDLEDQWKVSYRGELDYAWETPLSDPPKLPFITKDIEKGMILTHNECLEFLVSRESAGETQAWTFYGRHETALTLPAFGSFGVYGRIGLKPEVIRIDEKDIPTLLAALELGLQGNIRY